MSPLPRSFSVLPALAFTAVMVLSACVSGPEVPVQPLRADFSAAITDLNGRPGPPPGPKGACWQDEIRPAVIVTVTEQVQVAAKSADAKGKAAPAVFATETRQKIEKDRGTIWFRAPCPDLLDAEFIATLQRALKARGLYMAPLTGKIDKKTRQALHRYQASHGLESDKLSLVAAQELGLVPGQF